MTQLADQLIRAIKSSGQTRYAISKGAGVSQSQLSRLVSGERSISFDSAERLADHLNYEIVLRPKRRTRKA